LYSSPTGLTDEEMDVVRALAAPLARGQRGAFLMRVTDALAASRERGPGNAWGLASALQRQFYDPPKLSVERPSARTIGYAIRPRV
jgi:hypothetical protein